MRRDLRAELSGKHLRAEADAEERPLLAQRDFDPVDLAADIIVGIVGAHRTAEDDRAGMRGPVFPARHRRTADAGCRGDSRAPAARCRPGPASRSPDAARSEPAGAASRSGATQRPLARKGQDVAGIVARPERHRHCLPALKPQTIPKWSLISREFTHTGKIKQIAGQIRSRRRTPERSLSPQKAGAFQRWRSWSRPTAPRMKRAREQPEQERHDLDAEAGHHCPLVGHQAAIGLLRDLGRQNLENAEIETGPEARRAPGIRTAPDRDRAPSRARHAAPARPRIASVNDST